MKTYYRVLSGIIVLIVLALSYDASAKKVICVDGAGDGYLNNHEGWERQNMQPGDIIQVGGNLTDCMAQLMDGDELVIIAHGNNRGTGFKWGGMIYTGFGAGPGKMPVPPNFAGLDGVTVHFCSCWSKRDPDGTGTDTPLTEKIKDAMGGTGNTADGFQNLAEAGVCASFTCIPGVKKSEVEKAEKALENSNWADNPPANRPGANPNQQTAAQAAVDAAIGPGKCTVTITYKPPQDVIDPVELQELLDALSELLKSIHPFHFMTGCVCPDGDNGLGFVYLEGVPLVPSVPNYGPVFPGNGVWICEDPIVLPDNDFRIQPKDPFGPSMRFQFSGGFPLPPPGGVMSVPLNGMAIITATLNGGESFHNYTAPVVGFCTLNAPIFPPGTQPGMFVDIQLESLQIQGGDLPPDIVIGLNPDQPSTGMIAAIPEPDGSFTVDSFFDIDYRIDFLSNGSQVNACSSARTALHCGEPTAGCTNSGASNYDECAMIPAGECSPPYGGCTYPEAENYNPAATVDNGTCVVAPSSCPTDLTGDGVTNTNDLLLFLAEYGNLCTP